MLPAKVLVLGGGVVGTHAAKMAAGLGARVSIMDISLARLRQLADIMPANVNVLYSTRYAVRKQLRDTDLVVGAVLVPGARGAESGGPGRPGHYAARIGDRRRGGGPGGLRGDDPAHDA